VNIFDRATLDLSATFALVDQLEREAEVSKATIVRLLARLAEVEKERDYVRSVAPVWRRLNAAEAALGVSDRLAFGYQDRITELGDELADCRALNEQLRAQVVNLEDCLDRVVDGPQSW
jgi:chromosome segregation ATPase